MTPTLEEGPLKEAVILTRAVENVFRKLIRLLLGRMSLTKLQEMIRIIFVQEAEEQLRKEYKSKKIPLTKLALLTGLDTRTLSRISKELEKLHPLHQEDKFLKEITPECTVLDFWNTNPKYRDKESGSPLELSLKGENVSFEQLIKDSITSRGVTARSLLERLSASKSIEYNEKKQTVVLLDARYWPFEMEGATGAIELGLACVGNLIETIVHNVEVKADPSQLFFQRSNWTNRLDAKDIITLRTDARKLLSSVEEESIDILYRVESEEFNDNQITAGISLFYFEES